MIAIVAKKGLCSDRTKQKYTITLYNAYGCNKVEWEANGNDLFHRMDEVQNYVWDRSDGHEETVFMIG